MVKKQQEGITDVFFCANIFEIVSKFPIHLAGLGNFLSVLNSEGLNSPSQPFCEEFVCLVLEACNPHHWPIFAERDDSNGPERLTRRKGQGLTKMIKK
jgi:hypothetical protein